MPKAILFSDFDGTITLEDSNNHVTDKFGMGYDARENLNVQMKHENVSFKDGFYNMLVSVAHKGHTMEECIDELVTEIKLDDGFKETLNWCVSNDVDVVVVSSGMQIIINALLKKLVGDDLSKYITIYSNSHKFSEIDDLVENDGGWRINWRDDSSFGHDKNESIIHYVQKAYPDESKRGLLFYSGDGVSDISASRSCDILYAKKGMDLVDICIKDKIPYIEFDSFKDILSDMKSKIV